MSIAESSENETHFGVKQHHVPPNSIVDIEAIESLSETTEFSGSFSTVYKTAQYIYGNESYPQYLNEHVHNSEGKIYKNEDVLPFREIVLERPTTILPPAKLEHIYEEVGTIKELPKLVNYDILDYYEKYSPTTAKTLINTLFLPRHKICKQCASTHESPVYSDRLIYGKKKLYAKEVILYQQDDTVLFKFYIHDTKLTKDASIPEMQQIRHYMPVYNNAKSIAASILYLQSLPQDVFELQAVLQPSIQMICGPLSGVANTELYHRVINICHARTSFSGCIPMTFHINHDNVLSTIKSIGYDTDIQNWMSYRNDVFQSHSLKNEQLSFSTLSPERQPNRSSLLLLEPLLLMPDLARPRNRHDKNRMTHSEHIKIIRIVIAYTLSFFILTIITFYIVYFT